jgi:hypothetical protein
LKVVSKELPQVDFKYWIVSQASTWTGRNWNPRRKPMLSMRVTLSITWGMGPTPHPLAKFSLRGKILIKSKFQKRRSKICELFTFYWDSWCWKVCGLRITLF